MSGSLALKYEDISLREKKLSMIVKITVKYSDG